MHPANSGSSTRTYTYAAADGGLWDFDAIKTSIATDNAAAHVYSGVALNGALGGTLDPPRYVSVKTAVQAATYKTGASYPILFTGMYGGAVVTESLLLTNAAGGETIIGNQPFDTVTSISVPQQLGAAGAFEFGVDGVASKSRGGARDSFVAIRANAGGNVKLGFDAGYTDTIALAAAETQRIAAQRVYGNGGTAVAVTIFE